MGIEVANLLARIQMVAEGTSDVLRQAESIRTQLVEMGEAGSAAAAKISENQIKAAVALGRYENAVTHAADAQRKLEAAQARSGLSAEQAALKVAEITEELNRLNAAASGATQMNAVDAQRIKDLNEQLRLYQSVTKAASEKALAEHRVLSAGERLVVANRRLSDETAQTGKRFRILTTEITGVISAFRQGEVGSTLLARALIRIVDAAKAAGASLPKALAIGGAIGVAVLALGFIVKALATVNSAVAQSHLPDLSDDLKEVADNANITEGALKGVALATTNMFRAQDIANAAELTDVVARLADQLRFLTPDADLARTIQTISQGISTGNLESVAKEFGLSAARLEQAMGDTEGLSDAEITIRAINALLQETPNHMDRISQGIRDQKSGWAELGAQISGFWESVGRGAAGAVDIGVHVIQSIASAWDQGAREALRMREAESALNEAFRTGRDPADALADALLHLSNNHVLTATNMKKLQAISGLTEEKLADVNRALEQMGITLPIDKLKEFVGELGDVPPAAFDAKEAIKKFYEQVKDSQSIVNSIKGLAVAWHDMEADLTPGTALTAFTQLGDVIELVVTQGVESLELLRLQAIAAGRIGFATPEQVNAALAAYDAIQGALNPIAEEAQRVRDKLSENVVGGLDATKAAAELATGSVVTYINALNNIPRSVTTDIIQNFVSTGGRVTTTSTGGGGGTGGTGGTIPFGTNRLGLAGPVRGVTAAAATTQADTRRLDKDRRPFAAAELRTERAEGLADELRNVFDVLGLGKGGGGGGGGKAAKDLNVTIEQIRALISAVNQAVLIGLNGGVRFGTSGNVVPFIPGTFLNASGNQIAVEQIVIRGVWDFADPATRRQIVKELESALRELKAEL